ncbi:hypothetical protein KAI46_12225, partial [bacterium]|nr:hypothetical protein [bacterium]
MGELIVKYYPTKLFLKAADHTYVECGTGKKAWGCWGGKTGGKTLRQAAGSTKRADKIAQDNEKAGIKCYLINGVCHQAANRILLPAGITVRGVRGYSISQALFGPYGRVGIWPCRSPFKTYPNITGDIAECISKKSMAAIQKRSAEDKADWQYIQKVLPLYSEGEKLVKKKSFDLADARELNVDLFSIMADFELGPMMKKKLNANLREVRKQTEVSIEKAQLEMKRTKDIAKSKEKEYVKRFNKITNKFQDEMANLLTAKEYEALFALNRDERIVLADPDILKSEYG